MLRSVKAALADAARVSDREVSLVPVQERREYYVIFNFKDDPDTKVTVPFGSGEEREAAVAEFLAAEAGEPVSAVVRYLAGKAGDREAVADIVYEDKLVFWRLQAATPDLPDQLPDFPGSGELILRVTRIDGDCISAPGNYLARIKEYLDKSEKGFLQTPYKAELIWRRTACEGRNVLVKVEA